MKDTKTITKQSETLVCDFCVDHSRPVKWWFAAKDDIMEINEPPPKGQINVVLQSHPDGRSTVLAETKGRLILSSIGGRWAACDRCKHLVENSRVFALADMATKQFIKNHRLYTIPHHSEVFSIIYERILNVQQAFWRNYDGGPGCPLESNN